jgi:hypothetical protein
VKVCLYLLYLFELLFLTVIDIFSVPTFIVFKYPIIPIPTFLFFSDRPKKYINRNDLGVLQTFPTVFIPSRLDLPCSRMPRT